MFLKNTQSCFWSGRTAQNHLKVHTNRFLGVPITMVVARSLSDQQFVIKFVQEYHNWNLPKKPHDGPLPHTSLLPLPLVLPRWNLIITKNVLDLPIRKKYNWWRNMEHFVVIFFRCNILSNVVKYSESSPMISSFQDNAYIWSITEMSEYTASNWCHWNWHIQNLYAWSIKPFWAFFPGQNRVYFFP